MKCPNCETEFGSGYICPSCKVDAPLFTKTISISDSLYNAGLTKAKNSDMTGAIESLNKSLAFNKNNVAARNLVGLVNYEIGRIGDASKEWRISSSLLKENNPAADYIQQLDKNPRQLEKINDAVHMYNIAFDYIRQKSDDMAIIQLKKAIDTNPKFIDALNLLSLCYLMQGENDKAANTIEKTLAIDINNAISLHYYKLLHADKPRPGITHSVKKAPAAPTVKHKTPNDTGFGRSFPITGIISFIIGGLCAFAIIYILYIPEKISVKDKEIDNLQNSRVAEVQLLQKQLDEVNRQNTQLQETSKSEKDKNTVLEAQIALSTKKESIVNAERFIDKEQYQEAIDAASAVSTDGLPSDLLERLQNVKSTAYPKLVDKYYKDGVRLYNSGQYDSAQKEFENALRYVQSEDDIGDDVLYYLGRIAARANDVDNARVYFQRILDEYPNGNQVANATSRLKLLG